MMDGPRGNMIHSTVPPGIVVRACRFRTIDEYWFVLSGEGEIWRRATDGRESIARLIPGVCIDIPLGTAFQYRCTGGCAPRLHPSRPCRPGRATTRRFSSTGPGYPAWTWSSGPAVRLSLLSPPDFRPHGSRNIRERWVGPGCFLVKGRCSSAHRGSGFGPVAVTSRCGTQSSTWLKPSKRAPWRRTPSYKERR
jgi:hypothetical protein